MPKVALPPRMRLEEDTAFMLVGILERERVRLLVARAEMQEADIPAAVEEYNHLVRRIKRLQLELGRVMRDEGWLGPDE